MNYNESYELRAWDEALAVWAWVDVFETEAGAVQELNLVATGPGRWRVVRVAEVTLHTVVRAK